MVRLRVTVGGDANDGERTLALAAHPDGELTFNDGIAEVDAAVADAIVDRYGNIERVEEPPVSDNDGDDDVVKPPLDPADHTVGELRAVLDDGDYTAAELEGIAAAERAGDSVRETALDAIAVYQE